MSVPFFGTDFKAIQISKILGDGLGVNIMTMLYVVKQSFYMESLVVFRWYLVCRCFRIATYLLHSVYMAMIALLTSKLSLSFYMYLFWKLLSLLSWTNCSCIIMFIIVVLMLETYKYFSQLYRFDTKMPGKVSSLNINSYVNLYPRPWNLY